VIAEMMPIVFCPTNLMRNSVLWAGTFTTAPTTTLEAMMTVDVDKLIAANLDMLHQMLDRARTSALQASAAMTAGQRSLAIGHALDLDELLPESEALYRTVLMLHRSRHGEAQS
jgi:hypothetical protein